MLKSLPLLLLALLLCYLLLVQLYINAQQLHRGLVNMEYVDKLEYMVQVSINQVVTHFSSSYTSTSSGACTYCHQCFVATLHAC